MEHFHISKRPEWQKPRKANGILSEILMQMRDRSGYTQTFLANILGCSRQQYDRMERGLNRFKDQHLLLLSAIYGCEFRQLKFIQDVENIIQKSDADKDIPNAVLILQTALDILNESREGSTNTTDELIKSIVYKHDQSEEAKAKRIAILAQLLAEKHSEEKQIDAKMKRLSSQMLSNKGAETEELKSIRKQFLQLEERLASIQNTIAFLDKRHDKLNCK